MKGFYLGGYGPRTLWEAVRRKISDIAFPSGIDSLARKNYRIAQIDAVAIGLTNAAIPFVPVFLARLGAGET